MILVTGATGDIGSALLGELRTAGATAVRVLTREPGRVWFPEGIETVEGDLAVANSLSATLEGVRSLFLLSGMGGGGGDPRDRAECGCGVCGARVVDHRVDASASGPGRREYGRADQVVLTVGGGESGRSPLNSGEVTKGRSPSSPGGVPQKSRGSVGRPTEVRGALQGRTPLTR